VNQLITEKNMQNWKIMVA